MDEIPVEVLSRPPSVYKDRLIRELKRPFDKCEYGELMKKAAFKSKKIVIKELRSVKNAVETKSAGKVRERVIKTEDASNSFFNWYPGKSCSFQISFLKCIQPCNFKILAWFNLC